MDGVVLCNSHGHPPYLTACVPVSRPVSSCPMSTFQNLRPYGRRLPLLGFCFLLVLPPLSALTATTKQVVGQPDTTSYCGTCLPRRGIETVEGPIHRLLSVDGHEPS